MKAFFNKCVLLIFLQAAANGLIAQQNHFIYLQSENKQAFYVKLDKKILSSSASGYLIIPRLAEGSYTFVLGFPKNEWPEQKITCSIDKKDAGYIVKNFGDKGWGLFNWQTLGIVMADKKMEDAVVATEIKKENNPVKPTTPSVVEPAVTALPAPKEATTKPAGTIVKITDAVSADGVDMVFVDWINGQPDTIRVFIPAVRQSSGTTGNPAVVAQAVIKEEKEVLQKEIPTVQPQSLPEKKDSMPQPVQQVAVAVIPQKEVPAVSEANMVTAKTVLQNSDCKAMAAEEDFMKLRKKMAAEDNDDDMISVARKVFKTKCFTVAQVKNLSVLFLKDDGRYKFFDAAYPFVSDSYNFSSLGSLLTDEYYIARFKAMLRH